MNLKSTFMRNTLLFSFVLLSQFCFGQLKSVKGNWVSEKNETLSISDTTNNDNHLASNGNSRNLYIEFLNDILSFQERFYSSSDNYKKLNVVKYDLKIEEVNDSLLIATPVSEASKRLFKSSEAITFFNQEFIQDSSFVFEKLTFHTSACFGSCPVIHLEISSDKTLKYSSNFYKEKSFNETDTARSGNFTGTLSDKLFDELRDLIIQSKITALQGGQNQMLCCDGAIKTIILYHNGLRTYYKVMFEPRILRELISFLTTIDQNVDLKKVEEKFSLER
ncbi:hypothetical protein LV83_02292 [Algoriphagus yeomjeoni]|uniref:DUF6438 domain-containing protein n=2 Tax=Algoriphagus yeomjeoni TaxID=291403 RepID=A0A327PCM0_9BACT|nr:hypothetical protein LV83_02292 [Algoriphagus yeomjeoni]